MAVSSRFSDPQSGSIRTKKRMKEKWPVTNFAWAEIEGKNLFFSSPFPLLPPPPIGNDRTGMFYGAHWLRHLVSGHQFISPYSLSIALFRIIDVSLLLLLHVTYSVKKVRQEKEGRWSESSFFSRQMYQEFCSSGSSEKAVSCRSPPSIPISLSDWLTAKNCPPPPPLAAFGTRTMAALRQWAANVRCLAFFPYLFRPSFSNIFLSTEFFLAKGDRERGRL